MHKFLASVAVVGAFVGASSVDSTAMAWNPYFQGFETAGWVDPDWNSGVTQAASGTPAPWSSNPITSKTGSYHGALAGGGFAFTRYGGYSNDFGGGWRSSLDVYIDITDPKLGKAATETEPAVGNTYSWNLNSAINNQLSDPTHEDAYLTEAAFYVNPSRDAAQSALLVPGHLGIWDHAQTSMYTVTESGWYTLEWDWRDFGDNTLALDQRLKDDSGNIVHTFETASTGYDLSTQVGGNRYLWMVTSQFTYLAIDNTTLTSVPEPTTLSLLGIGGLALLRRSRKICR